MVGVIGAAYDASTSAVLSAGPCRLTFELTPSHLLDQAFMSERRHMSLADSPLDRLLISQPTLLRYYRFIFQTE